MVDQMKQAAPRAQSLLALRTAVFMRGDVAEKTVQRRKWSVIAPQIQSLPQCGNLPTEKEQKSPQRAAVQCPLVDHVPVGNAVADFYAALDNVLYVFL